MGAEFSWRDAQKRDRTLADEYLSGEFDDLLHPDAEEGLPRALALSCYGIGLNSDDLPASSEFVEDIDGWLAELVNARAECDSARYWLNYRRAWKATGFETQSRGKRYTYWGQVIHGSGPEGTDQMRDVAVLLTLAREQLALGEPDGCVNHGAMPGASTDAQGRLRPDGLSQRRQLRLILDDTIDFEDSPFLWALTQFAIADLYELEAELSERAHGRVTGPWRTVAETHRRHAALVLPLGDASPP